MEVEVLKYFYDPVPEYQTRGVAAEVHPVILIKCVDMLNVLKSKGIEPDYLQVFVLSFDVEKNVLRITHTQEQPDYCNEDSICLPSCIKPYNDKLYYIDDGNHRTFLKAEEY